MNTLLVVSLVVMLLASVFCHIYGQLKDVWRRLLYVYEALESILDRLSKLEDSEKK